MNYAIEYYLKQHAFLHSTPRKKSLKHSLLTIHTGMVLVRLGKYEYALEQGDSFWIPFDCLVSVTFFPDTTASAIEFSARLVDSFPSQSGFIELPEVTSAIISKLARQQVSGSQKKALLGVVRHEVCELKPELILGQLSQCFSEWTPEQPVSLCKEMHIALLVREAKKQRLSGKKQEKIVEELFHNSKENFEHLCQLVLGTEL
ncbi:AraC family transcriptional regulator [Vibrio albus]|uniref:AraC family transcriptional regulator n=1 Tax=Vibrio albus TaxID=2200953 RepID=A0A2U3B687_9VIBR|nr:AraC family transcriptional regulator [Vibrio albus]PWI32297.1 AraC family transcriptional regulator [Vibrio albus]